RRGPRVLRPGAARAGQARGAAVGGAAVNWRILLLLLLAAGAIVSGWSVWTQRDGMDPGETGPARSDYVLHDFEVVTLDGEGRESFSLKAPLLRQTPGARTMELTTPL